MPRGEKVTKTVEPKFQVSDVCVFESQIKEKFGYGLGRNCRIIGQVGPDQWSDPQKPEYLIQNFGGKGVIRVFETDLEPAVVHGLFHSLPLCLFVRELPKEWPVGHTWARKGSHEHINCPLCKARVGKVSDGWI